MLSVSYAGVVILSVVLPINELDLCNLFNDFNVSSLTFSLVPKRSCIEPVHLRIGKQVLCHSANVSFLNCLSGITERGHINIIHELSNIM
jgi:hypothetical protein